MTSSLSPEQNEYARALLRELLVQYRAQGKTQADLGRALGLNQSAISALTRAHAIRGTSLDVLLAAARMCHRPLGQVAHILGWPKEELGAWTPTVFAIGAGAALLDGADKQDVAAVRRELVWQREGWTWSRIREEILFRTWSRMKGK